jgi:hypothetical protein
MLNNKMDNERLIALKEKLNEIKLLPNDYWINSLNERKKKELEFHDQYRDKATIGNIDQDTYDKIYSNKKY